MAKDTEMESISPQDLTEGLPAVNWGALFMPAIWGPAHGVWLAILFYPIWLFADNLFYAAYSDPTPMSLAFALVTALVLAGATIIFARAGQPHALLRDLKRGKTKEEYAARQRKWAVAMGILAVVMIGAATYYNLVIRPTLGA